MTRLEQDKEHHLKEGAILSAMSKRAKEAFKDDGREIVRRGKRGAKSALKMIDKGARGITKAAVNPIARAMGEPVLKETQAMLTTKTKSRSRSKAKSAITESISNLMTGDLRSASDLINSELSRKAVNMLEDIKINISSTILE